MLLSLWPRIECQRAALKQSKSVDELSLVPGGDLDGHALAGAASRGGEEVSSDGNVLLLGHVELAWLHVLELRVVNALLWDDLSTDEEHAHDLEIGHLVEHAELAESVLSEVIETLEETFEKVLELVVDGTFLAELLVVEEPEGVSFEVDLLHELVPTFASLVGHIHVVSLEVEEIEGGGRQGIKWVDVLLWLISSGLLLGLGSLGLSSLLGLLLGLDLRLDALLGDSDSAEGGDEFGKGGNALKPLSGLGGGLGEALIENDLEGEHQGSTENEISDGAAVANEPVTLEAGVDGANVLLDLLDTIIELLLADLSTAKDGHDSTISALGVATLRPEEPLVDLGALDLIAAQEGGMASCQELGDGKRLLEVALGCLEKGELVGWVEFLVFLRLSRLLRVNDELGHFASDSADEHAVVDQDVAWVLGVDFLQARQDKVLALAHRKVTEISPY